MKLIHLLTASVLCIGCREDVRHARPIDTTTILPLEVGNRWTWQVTSDNGRVHTETTEILFADTVAGVRYFLTDTSNGTRYSPAFRERPLWLTSDGKLMYGYPDEAWRGYGAYLTRAVGDTFADEGLMRHVVEGGGHEPPFHRFAIVTAVDEEVTVPAGTFRCIRAEWRTVDTGGIPVRTPASPEGWVLYAPGIGKVMEMEYVYEKGRRVIGSFRQLSGVELKCGPLVREPSGRSAGSRWVEQRRRGSHSVDPRVIPQSRRQSTEADASAVGIGSVVISDNRGT